MIELKHTRADDIASVIRDAYTGRILATAQKTSQRTNQSTGNRAPQNPQQQRPQQAAKQTTNTSKRQSQQSANQEPKMTLAVDKRSNSIVVTAPEQLFNEVEELLLSLDQKGAQKIQVLPTPRGSTDRVKQTLDSLFRERTRVSTSATGAKPAPKSGP